MSLVLAVLGAARAAFRTRADLALENLALRQQLALPSLEAAAVRALRSHLLGMALQAVGRVARGAPRRSPRDSDSLASAGVSRLLDVEVPTRANGSTAGPLGACRARPHHGARQSSLGRAPHSRRTAQAGVRRFAGGRCASHAAPPEATLADLASVPPEPRRRPCLR